jgi:fumarylacetoacetase
MANIDRTHDPKRRSFVASANGHADFPIQNLPFGIFSPPGDTPRGGVAIGDSIFDLAAALDAGLVKGAAAEAAAGTTLNAFFAMPAVERADLRTAIGDLLDETSSRRAAIESPGANILHRAADCTMHLPAHVGDYTDFYVGIHHAINVGKVFRPDNPLLPNYKYVPIGYHGRASSLGVSGETIARPNGQRKLPTETEPAYGPCRNLDYELELGIWIGPGNRRGAPISIGSAADHVAGLCLLNDWSARDIQVWENQPLGPFLAKNFATTISPWVVTAQALAPFRIAQLSRPEGDPKPLPYLWDARDQAEGAFDLALDVLILTPAMKAKRLAPHVLARSHAKHMYWTIAQLVAHHTCNGCDLRPGDLLGSGTISTPGPEGFGALLEMTRGGSEPVALPSGETRRYLEDGDEIIFHGRARRDGCVQIGFGKCRGTIGSSA